VAGHHQLFGGHFQFCAHGITGGVASVQGVRQQLGRLGPGERDRGGHGECVGRGVKGRGIRLTTKGRRACLLNESVVWLLP